MKVADSIVERIVALIRENQHGPGTRLPGERALAERLGVSRASVREAIRRLEVLGLLEGRQGLGTFIKPPGAEAVPAATIPHALLDQETLRKIFEVREFIEVEAVGRAAERATSEQKRAVEEALGAMEHAADCNDLDATIVADVEFHRRVIVAAGNEILVSLMDSIMDLLHEMRYTGASLPSLRKQARESHRAILQAIEEGDPQAARQAMQRHLDEIAARVWSVDV